MKYRRRYEQAVLNTFRRWLDGDLPRTPSGSRLHKAITYTLSRWTALVCYVQNIRLPVDNNRAENVIRQGRWGGRTGCLPVRHRRVSVPPPLCTNCCLTRKITSAVGRITFCAQGASQTFTV